MIDTIKLVIPFSECPKWLNNFEVIEKRKEGFIKAVNNPTSIEKSQGVYRPRFTFIRRLNGKNGGIVHELTIEVSLPKLLFGNNFEEVTEKDFDEIADKIVVSMSNVGIPIDKKQIIEASVRRVDFGKNIILPKYASIASTIEDIKSTDISKVYNSRDTIFENGGIGFQIHCNTMDISFYDKNSDLRRSLISEKRSIEDDNYIQKHLTLLENNRRATLRFEVRFGNKRRINSELRAIGVKVDDELKFADIFRRDIARSILIAHWNKITSKIPKAKKICTDSHLKRYEEIIKNEGVTPQGSLAIFGLLLLSEAENADTIRGVIEKRFGRSAWYRLKKLTDIDISNNELEMLLFIGKAIAKMEPITKANLGVK